MHSDNLQNWILWRDKMFCDFFIIFYYLDCTKCKFPDFFLTFAKSGISLTFPRPLDTLVWHNIVYLPEFFVDTVQLQNYIESLISRYLYYNSEKYPLSPLKPRGLVLLSWHVPYTIEVQGIRCTNHLHDSCPFTDVNPHFTAPGGRYYFKINSWWPIVTS